MRRLFLFPLKPNNYLFVRCCKFILLVKKKNPFYYYCSFILFSHLYLYLYGFMSVYVVLNIQYTYKHLFDSFNYLWLSSVINYYLNFVQFEFFCSMSSRSFSLCLCVIVSSLFELMICNVCEMFVFRFSS